MAQVRLLVIPQGQKVDAEGKGHGSDWPLAHLGDSDSGDVWLTTDHAHASDVCDDPDLSGTLALGKFIVAALNGRGWRWTRHERPPVGDLVLGWRGGVPVLMALECDNPEQGVVWGVFDGVGGLESPEHPPERWRPLPEPPPPPRAPYVPPAPVPYVAPDLTARNCGTCRHWSAVVDMNRDDPDDTTGVCDNPARPWDTPEREKSHGHWSAALDAGEVWPCWEAKVAPEVEAAVKSQEV